MVIMVVVASLPLRQLFVVITIAITIVVKNSRMKPITEKNHLLILYKLNAVVSRLAKLL